MKAENIRKGKSAEDDTALFLEKNGYAVIARNFRTRTGEIDIIALKGDTIYFIEVKYRSYNLVSPLEMMTPAKQEKMRNTAEIYLQKNVSYCGHSVSFCLSIINQKREVVFYDHLF